MDHLPPPGPPPGLPLREEAIAPLKLPAPLLDQFNIIPLTQISEPESASIFFVGYEHKQGQRAVAHNLIAHLAHSYNVVLFIEGTESLKPVSDPEKVKIHWLQLDPSLHDSVAIYGWDIDTKKEIHGCDLTTYQAALNTHQEVTQKIEKLRSILSHIDFFHPEIEKILASLPIEHLLTLEKLQDDLERLCHIQTKMEAILERGLISTKEIERTFPKRVDAMVNTFESIPRLDPFPSSPKETVFVFTSGFAHLDDEHEKERLKPFHDTLLPREDAIVLIVKP